MGTGDRLLDEQDARRQPLELRRVLHAPPQVEQRGDVVVLFVAVEGDEIGLGNAIDDAGDVDQPRQIGRGIAADLEFEVAVAVGGDDLFQRFRQSIVDLSRVAANDVDKADGMARGDAIGGLKSREKMRHSETRQIGQMAGEEQRIDAGKIGAHAVVERTIERQEQRIENSAIDLGRSEIGDQRIEMPPDAGFDLLAVMGGEMAEGGAGLAIRITAGGKPERQAQLSEVVLIRQRQILVEPFRRQQFGGRAPLRTAIGKFDADAHKALWRLGQCHDAKAKRHPKADVTLVEPHLPDKEMRAGHARDAKCRSGAGPASQPGRRHPARR